MQFGYWMKWFIGDMIKLGTHSPCCLPFDFQIAAKVLVLAYKILDDLGLVRRGCVTLLMTNSWSNAWRSSKMHRIHFIIQTARDTSLQADHCASKLSYSRNCYKIHCISTYIFHFFRAKVFEFEVLTFQQWASLQLQSHGTVSQNPGTIDKNQKRNKQPPVCI